jgi:hypothetical protein
MGSQKPRIVMQLLQRTAANGTLGLAVQFPVDGVVLSDTDVVWLRSPHNYFAEHPLADVMISTDCLSHRVTPPPPPPM